MGFLRFSLLLFTVALLTSTALSDLILSKVDRCIDLTSQIVRITSTLKVENPDSNPVSEVLLAFPERQAKNLAYLTATLHGGKGKAKTSAATLPVEVANPNGKPQGLNFYSVSLQKKLVKGDSLILDVLAVFTHALQPFPEKITQADVQLGLFQESAHYLSPYVVKVVLPEGSKDIVVSSPFPVKQSEEAKLSHLDIVGRPLVVLEKTNIVPEHNQYFQVFLSSLNGWIWSVKASMRVEIFVSKLKNL
ncbi:putative ribophorin [Tripterygium wilfordii]|uniref:Dolichyl-diphosphooligosaccharide--protein glycosyltransferase subunit 1 n=1 Tax=Tripterygium wilfordii TaxID=458696 RepID=A0A7J7CZ42_TRIWF|nr:putative ribophorin [Tripterygium wilfordii]